MVWKEYNLIYINKHYKKKWSINIKWYMIIYKCNRCSFYNEFIEKTKQKYLGDYFNFKIAKWHG